MWGQWNLIVERRSVQYVVQRIINFIYFLYLYGNEVTTAQVLLALL